jgi:GH15 family glucan-1,4-alpha-glucosidase
VAAPWIDERVVRRVRRVHVRRAARIVASAPDGLDGDEGTFSMCSFWCVECLARASRLEDAQLAFEKMLTYANHLGLYSEKIGPTGEPLGNLPQAFTHTSR